MVNCKQLKWKKGKTVNNIRKVREEKHINRAQLAKLSGVPLRTIEDWEAGKTVPTNAYQLLKVAKVLGCRIEDLICAADGEK